MKIGVLLVGLLLVFSSIKADDNYNQLLKPGFKHWECNLGQFLKNFPHQYRFQDQNKNSLLARSTPSHPLKLWDLTIPEVEIKLTPDQKIAQYQLKIYTRGDSPYIRSTNFRDLLSNLHKLIYKYSETRDTDFENTYLAGARIRTRIWQTPRYQIRLRWSRKKRQPEYIIMDILPPDAPTSQALPIASQVDGKQLKQRVQRTANGDVFLNLPMVDQGTKGYCVVASIERVLRFYGSEIDQHLMAQLAQSSARTGTNIFLAENILRDLKKDLKIKSQVLYNSLLMQKRVTYKALQKQIKSYNRFAHRHDAPKLKMREITSSKRNAEHSMTDLLFSEVNFKALTDFRVDDAKNYRNFTQAVHRFITSGVPLCWVTISPPSAPGNPSSRTSCHMRLINGYNDKTQELIYTDSWGFGHEKKRMKFPEAWALTHVVWVILPD